MLLMFPRAHNMPSDMLYTLNTHNMSMHYNIGLKPGRSPNTICLRGLQISGECCFEFHPPKRNCRPTIWAPTESWIVEKDEEMSQMWPSKVGGRGQIVETKNHLTLGRLLSNTQKKVFESRSMVPRWFVDRKVVVL